MNEATKQEQFRDPAAPLETRVEDLLHRLTREEKVRLLAGAEAFALEGVARLKIPSLRLTDGPTGVRSNRGKEATVFPVAVALAATFNPAIVGEIASAIGREARALGEVAILAPTINIVRTPVWGRNFETYSEDPYLTAQMGIAYVDGLQGEGIGASLKHYAVNNQELDRFSISAEVDERTLREIYLFAFEQVVKASNPWTVMASYNKVNGTFASENRYLLTDILKTEWGYDGVVVSDWGAVHSSAPAANAGLDLEMPGPPKWFGEKLLRAVETGEVSERQIDENTKRMIRFILRTGALDGLPKPEGELLSPRHRTIARDAAEESVVLLKNEENALPLDPLALKSLAIIGPSIENLRIQGDGSSRVYSTRPLALRDCLAAIGNSVKLTFADGVDNEPFPRLAQARLFSTDATRDTEGLISEYYVDGRFDGPPLRKSVERRFFRYMGENPPKGTPLAYRWHGLFWPRRTGTHEFSILGRGRGRLVLDGKTLIDERSPVVEDRNDLTGGGTVRRIAQAELEISRPVSVELEFAWEGIPKSLLYMNLGVREPVGSLEEAVAAAKAAEAAIVMVGSASTTEAEGYDRETIDLPGRQNALVEAIAAVNPRTIVVVNAGAPMAMPWIDKVGAALITWLPGEEGPTALCNLLFGRASPSGRLPVSFPKSLEDDPARPYYRGGASVSYGEGLFVGYRHFDKNRVAPLFPFGHGLTYTRFEYSDLSAPKEARVGDAIEVRVTIGNTGRVTAKEVVQLYVAPESPTVVRPPKELKAFVKVQLAPGEKKSVALSLDARAFAHYDPKQRRWVVDPGDYGLLVGASAGDIRLTKMVRLV
jgi:beta-glucosidase